MDLKRGNAVQNPAAYKSSGHVEDILDDTSSLSMDDCVTDSTHYPTMDTEEMAQLVENQTVIEFKTCKSKSFEEQNSSNQIPSDVQIDKENINPEVQHKGNKNISRIKDGFKGSLSNISSFSVKKNQSISKSLKHSANKKEKENAANNIVNTDPSTPSYYEDNNQKSDISTNEKKTSLSKITDLKTNLKGSMPSLHNLRQSKKLDKEKDLDVFQKCNCTPTEKNSIRKEVIKEITTKGGQTIELEKWLHKQPYNANVVDKDLGKTVLHLACDGNHIDAVKVIMAHQPCRNIKDGADETPIRVAIKKENFQCIEECLKETQCHLNIRDKKEAEKLLQRKENQVILDCHCKKYPIQRIDNKILTAITKKGNKARKLVNLITHDESVYIVQRWLQKGSNVNLIDQETRQTILHLASNYNREDIIGVIVDYEPCMTLVDDNKETPMSIAWRKGHLGCLRILLNADDISCEAFASAKKSIFDQMKKYHKKEGEFISMRKQKPEATDSIYSRLTQMPASVKAKMNGWKESLSTHDRSSSSCESDIAENNEEFCVDEPSATQSLLYTKTNNNLQTNWRLCGCSVKNKELNKEVERTIIANGDVKVIRKWINDKEKKINAITKSKGQTSLHLACEYNRPNVVDVLMEHNPCLTVKDNNNESPAMIALRKNNQECLQRLVKAKDTKCNIEEHYRREGDLIKDLEKELHIDKFKLMNKFSALLPIFCLFLMILSIIGSELLVNYTSFFSLYHHCEYEDHPVELITFIQYPFEIKDESLNICNRSVILHLEGEVSSQFRSFRNCCIWMSLFSAILLLFSAALWWANRRQETKLLPQYLMQKIRKSARSRKTFYVIIIFCVIATIVWLVVSRKLRNAISELESIFEIDLIKENNPSLCGGDFSCDEGEVPDTSPLTHAKNLGFCCALLCTIFFVPLYLWMKLSVKLKKTTNVDQQHLTTRRSNANVAATSNTTLA